MLCALKQIKSQAQEIKSQAQALELLKNLIKDLELKIAHLQKDSQNSSKPPSTDKPKSNGKGGKKGSGKKGSSGRKARWATQA